MQKKNNMLKWSIIISVLLITLTLFFLVGYGMKTPKITRGEFPFTITYEYKGEITTISDTLICEYDGAVKSLFSATDRFWNYSTKQNENILYFLLENDNESLYLDIGMDAAYYMGDPLYKETIQYLEEAFNGEIEFNAPCGYYCNAELEIDTFDVEELEKQGFKLLSYEYPEPIKNSFHFAGVSLNNETFVILPFLTAIFMVVLSFVIRKNKNYKYTTIDIVSLVLNILVCVLTLPFSLLLTALWGIGGEDELFETTLVYAIPTLTVLGVGFSILLRRKQKKLPGLLIQFIGPVLFAFLLFMDMFLSFL